MLDRFRGLATTMARPLVAFLARLGIAPATVTLVGTVGVVLASLVLLPLGLLWQAAVAIGFFGLWDALDGQLARHTRRANAWGAFLDASADRIADGAVLVGVVLYFAGARSDLLFAGITLWALVFAQATSYVKARGEAEGFIVRGGLITRADRLALVVLGAGLAGGGVPYALQVAMVTLAVLGTVTVVQRMASVHRQYRLLDGADRAVDPAAGSGAAVGDGAARGGSERARGATSAPMKQTHQ